MNNTLTPIYLDDFIINKDIADSLKLITKDNVINMIFNGQANTGRKTLVYSFLNTFNKCNIYKLHIGI